MNLIESGYFETRIGLLVLGISTICTMSIMGLGILLRDDINGTGYFTESGY